MRNLLVLYSRLSLADSEKEETDASNSIKNQQSILKDYVRNHEELLEYEIMEVCDDGYSGTNFQRPGIQKVLELTRKGDVKCILVKDFSRFGRNYIEVGVYLEQLFPFLKVRFISVNDHFDSQRDSAAGAIDVGFKNLMHDYYSRNMGRKVSQAKRFRAEQGTIIMPAFYGYKKAADGSGNLVVDEVAAAVVRTLFEKRAEGMLLRDIAKHLNGKNIPTPSGYKKQQSGNKMTTAEFWRADIIAPILKDVRYTGVFIFGKKRNLNFKEKKMPESEWITSKSNFEAIISKDLFERVNGTLYKRDAGTNRKKKSTLLFAGKLYCGCCGRKLYRRHTRYECRATENIVEADCSRTTCTEKQITGIVLSNLNQILVLHDVEFTDNKNVSERNAMRTRLQKLLTKSQNEILPIYEKYVSGELSLEAYENERNCLEQKIGNIQKELTDIEREIEVSSKKNQVAETLERERQDGKIKSLTSRLVDTLIEKIVVYDKDRLEIVWKFADFMKGDV